MLTSWASGHSRESESESECMTRSYPFPGTVFAVNDWQTASCLKQLLRSLKCNFICTLLFLPHFVRVEFMWHLVLYIHYLEIKFQALPEVLRVSKKLNSGCAWKCIAKVAPHTFKFMIFCLSASRLHPFWKSTEYKRFKFKCLILWHYSSLYSEHLSTQWLGDRSVSKCHNLSTLKDIFFQIFNTLCGYFTLVSWSYNCMFTKISIVFGVCPPCTVTSRQLTLSGPVSEPWVDLRVVQMGQDGAHETPPRSQTGTWHWGTKLMWRPLKPK